MKITLEEIKRAACRKFGITLEAMNGNKHTRHIAWARMAAMALCRELTCHSYPRIGRAFNRDHTTVLYATEKVAAYCIRNQEYGAKVSSLRNTIIRWSRMRERLPVRDIDPAQLNSTEVLYRIIRVPHKMGDRIAGKKTTSPVFALIPYSGFDRNQDSQLRAVHYGSN